MGTQEKIRPIREESCEIFWGMEENHRHNGYEMPYETEPAETARSLGMDYILHICGDTTRILNDMAQLPVDVLELDYKTDLQKMHDVLADKITVSGNLDPSGVFYLGTPETVREATRKLLEVYRDSPRLIACSGCALGTDVPEANIRAFIETVRADA